MQNPASSLSPSPSAQCLAQSTPLAPSSGTLSRDSTNQADSALARIVPMNNSHSPSTPSGLSVQHNIDMRDKDALLADNPALAELVETVTDKTYRPTLEKVADLLSDDRITAKSFKEVAISSQRGYTRNTLIKTDKVEVTVLKWRPGQITSIHDHKGSACALKVLEGDITEIKYRQSGEKKAKEVSRIQHRLGAICAAKDEDIHALINESSDQEVTCLHLYMPPVKNNTIFTLDNES